MLQRFMYFGWERNELKKSHRVKFNSVFVLKKKKKSDGILFYEKIQSGITRVQV